MAVIVLANASGAPGVTAATIAATHLWRRTALMVEADTSVTSSVLAGHFRASRHHTSGLSNLLALDATRQLTPTTALGQRLPLLPEDDPEQALTRAVIPGFSSLEAGASSSGFWASLAHTLRGLSDIEHDVLVDVGRWRLFDDRTPLLEAADLVLLLCRPHVPEILAARALAGHLRQHVDTSALQTLQLVTVSDGLSNHYSAAEVSQAVGAPVLSEISHDPKTARVFSHGDDAPSRLTNRPYLRSIRALNAAIESAVATRRDVLATQPTGV